MKTDFPNLFIIFKWTTYPQVSANLPAHPTIGGIDLTVSSYSKHKALAEQAVLCLRAASNQLEAAVAGGLPPTLKSLYENPTPAFVSEYPFYQDILTQLTTAAIR